MPARDAGGSTPLEAASLTVGAMAAATGIPAETLRTWERRYGYPVAARKASGHRVYPLATVARLRRIARAMALGHRAAEVVPATDATLDLLLDTEPGEVTRNRTDTEQVPASIDELLDAVVKFDTDRLRRAFQADWARLGPLEFLERRAAPLLTAIGTAWEAGDLDVRHEHVASASLGDFLRTVRGPHDASARGPSVALATLDGEMHGMGLQMCATVFALAGWRSLVVGVNTPLVEIAALVAEARVDAVAISVVQPQGGGGIEAVVALRARIPMRVPLLLGGAGVPPAFTVKGVEVLDDLRQLDRWARRRAH